MCTGTDECKIEVSVERLDIPIAIFGSFLQIIILNIHILKYTHKIGILLYTNALSSCLNHHSFRIITGINKEMQCCCSLIWWQVCFWEWATVILFGSEYEHVKHSYKLDCGHTSAGMSVQLDDQADSCSKALAQLSAFVC